jgi:hypothetical protein
LKIISVYTKVLIYFKKKPSWQTRAAFASESNVLFTVRRNYVVYNCKPPESVMPIHVSMECTKRVGGEGEGERGAV